MIALQAPGPAATAATVAIAGEHGAPRPLPSARVERMVVPAHAAPSTIADRRGRADGAASIREPTATARIAAAAASSRARRRRPPSVPLASLLLPAGSMATRASPIAERSNRERAGTTRPSRHARRKARTSSAPSLKPMPRTAKGATGTPASLSASKASLSLHLSAAIAAGAPNRSSAARNNVGSSTADRPARISSPRSRQSM